MTEKDIIDIPTPFLEMLEQLAMPRVMEDAVKVLTAHNMGTYFSYRYAFWLGWACAMQERHVPSPTLEQLQTGETTK